MERQPKDKERSRQESRKYFMEFFAKHIPFHREHGFEIVSLGAGRCTARVPYNPDFVGNPTTGVLHGGVVTALLDSVGGAAVMTRLRAPIPVATIDLRIDYLRQSGPHEAVCATVECYKVTRHVAFTRGFAFNQDEDDPIAAMAATYMIHANRAPGPAAPRDP